MLLPDRADHIEVVSGSHSEPSSFLLTIGLFEGFRGRLCLVNCSLAFIEQLLGLSKSLVKGLVLTFLTGTFYADSVTNIRFERGFYDEFMKGFTRYERCDSSIIDPKFSFS